MNISDYAMYPSPEDWDSIIESKKQEIKKIELKNENKKYNLLDPNHLVEVDLASWRTEFNNRAFDLINNYVMLKSYFNMGIPDEEWYISPGKNGQSIQYFPHFEEKHHIHHYWFGFYSESYYTRFFSLIDTIYHLTNVKYEFDIDPGLGFNGKVLNELKSIDKDLYDVLQGIKTNDVYGKASDYRNDTIHNYRPNQIDSGYKKEKLEGGGTKWTMSVGDYTPTTSIVKNIEESIEFLADLTDKIREKLESM